jgi:hypothetical protein
VEAAGWPAGGPAKGRMAGVAPRGELIAGLGNPLASMARLSGGALRIEAWMTCREVAAPGVGAL